MVRTTDVKIAQGDVLKEDDSAPNLEAQLVEESSGGTLSVSGSTSTDPVDLTGATVVLNVADSGGTLVVDSASCTIEDEANGQVSYDWSSSEPGAAGSYEAEFEVTDGNGENISYPNTGTFSIEVNEQLG